MCVWMYIVILDSGQQDNKFLKINQIPLSMVRDVQAARGRQTDR